MRESVSKSVYFKMFKWIDSVDKKLNKKKDEIVETIVERNTPRVEEEYEYEGQTDNVVTQQPVYAEQRKEGVVVDPWLRPEGVVFASDLSKDTGGGVGVDDDDGEQVYEERTKVATPSSPPPSIPNRGARSQSPPPSGTTPQSPRKLQPGQRIPASSLQYLDSPPDSPRGGAGGGVSAPTTTTPAAVSPRSVTAVASPATSHRKEATASPPPTLKKSGNTTASTTSTSPRTLGSSMPGITRVSPRDKGTPPLSAASPQVGGQRSPRGDTRSTPQSPAPQSREARMDEHVIKLQKLKTLYESELITKEDYDEKRKALLESFMAK